MLILGEITATYSRSEPPFSLTYPSSVGPQISRRNPRSSVPDSFNSCRRLALWTVPNLVGASGSKLRILAVYEDAQLTGEHLEALLLVRMVMDRRAEWGA